MNIRTSRALLIASFLLKVGCGEDEAVTPHGAAGSSGTGGSTGVDAGGAGPGPLFGERVPVSETVSISGVGAPVDIVRDRYGMVHIYARSLEDVMFAQGYMMAVDRHGQLELLRRVAAGRLAELVGGLSPDQIDDDITMRTIGLQRTADQIYQQMEAGSLPKRAVDAFAKGISAWIANLNAGKVQRNAEFVAFDTDAFTPWNPQDSIAMGRVQSWNLSYDADSDISLTDRWNQALATFTAQNPDPDLAKRAGYMKDMMRFEPVDPTTPIVGYPNGTAALTSATGKKNTRLARSGTRAALAAARSYVTSVERVKRRFGFDESSGSNNWAVDAAHSESGAAMVASDPHLGLSSPMIFWPCHLVVDNPSKPDENIEVAGIAFAGIPGVILGATRHIAWGSTVTNYDVTDAFEETISTDGQGVMFKGVVVPFQKFSQTMGIAGGRTYSWDVLVVPHHGPIVPNIVGHQVVPPAPGGKALSVRWTGHQPSTEFEAVLGLVQAKNVDEARAALDKFGVGGQNWMLADSSGNIAWTSHVLLPHRDARTLTFNPNDYSGVHPLLVLNGSSGEHEWTGGFLESKFIPQDKNPPSGFIATANADNLGVTLDNNPTNDTLSDGTRFYIGGNFEPGWRVGRIYERLKAETANGGKLSPDEMSSIQGDVRYRLAEKTLAPMLTALEHALVEAQTPNSFPEVQPVVSDPRFAAANIADVIATLRKWSTELGYEPASAMNPDDNTPATDPKEVDASKATAIFSAWVVRAMAFAFEDEAKLLGGRQNIGDNYTVKGFVRLLTLSPQSDLATFDAASGESVLWDDVSTKGVTERRDAVLGLALLAAIDDLNKLLGTDRSGWRWGKLHTLRFSALVPLLWDAFSNPPLNSSVFPNGFPRPGGQNAVDVSNFAIMRGKAQELDFKYGSGPTQRFVAEMTRTGPVIRNAHPGGAVADTRSKHFKDDAELWRRNQTHPVPFEIADVAAAWEQGEEHIRMNPVGP